MQQQSQAEMVASYLSAKVGELEKDKAVLLANLQIANAELAELRAEKETTYETSDN